MQEVASASADEAAELESPGHVRLSLAAAMTLGLKPGRFYRDAKLRCINLLQVYPGGCVARCAYCGLAKGRAGQGPASSFIRVGWPTHGLDTVLDAMAERPSAYDRVCLSMISRKRATADLIEMVRRVRARLDVPISALLTPTYVDLEALVELRRAGVDRMGIAVDAATPELFDTLRGEAAGGPHRWERYWQGLAEAAEVFGEWMAGCHLIVGLGETEQQMVATLCRVRRSGCVTHLFSFFPEEGSGLEDREPPPIGQYRRIQLARYLIDEGVADGSAMTFDAAGRLTSFGNDEAVVEAAVAAGEPWRTSGCPGRDGQVACNRPFANCRPGLKLRNYPFPLEPDDVTRVRSELWS